MCLMRQTVEFTQFVELFRKGVEPDQIVKQMNISHTRYSRLYEKTTRHDKDVRRLARRAIREKEYRMKTVSRPDCAVVAKQVQLSRSELLAHIASLLRCNGVWANMRHYEKLDNKKLAKVRERLMRNRSDKYQLVETRC